MPRVYAENHLKIASVTYPQERVCTAIDSPISVPIPSTDPDPAINALSPPLEPPDVRLLLRGFTVRPNVLFTDSAIIIAADTEVSKQFMVAFDSDSTNQWGHSS